MHGIADEGAVPSFIHRGDVSNGGRSVEEIAPVRWSAQSTMVSLGGRWTGGGGGENALGSPQVMERLLVLCLYMLLLGTRCGREGFPLIRDR